MMVPRRALLGARSSNSRRKSSRCEENALEPKSEFARNHWTSAPCEIFFIRNRWDQHIHHVTVESVVPTIAAAGPLKLVNQPAPVTKA